MRVVAHGQFRPIPGGQRPGPDSGRTSRFQAAAIIAIVIARKKSPGDVAKLFRRSGTAGLDGSQKIMQSG
jgi:hypothetical protein